MLYQGAKVVYTESAYDSGNTEKNILSGNNTFIRRICGNSKSILVGQFPQKLLSTMKAKSVDSRYHI